VRPARGLLVCAALVLGGGTGAQAAETVLLKGSIVSSRHLRSLSTVTDAPSGMETIDPDALMAVRIKVDAVLAGHWRARTAVAELRHMAHALAPGTQIYVVFAPDTHGRRQPVAWDFADHGVCLTPKQQAEYGIDPAALPAAERCNPE
jgi:hypothetical protein